LDFNSKKSLDYLFLFSFKPRRVRRLADTKGFGITIPAGPPAGGRRGFENHYKNGILIWETFLKPSSPKKTYFCRSVSKPNHDIKF